MTTNRKKTTQRNPRPGDMVTPDGRILRYVGERQTTKVFPGAVCKTDGTVWREVGRQRPGAIPTYEAKINGRTVRVTVPENEDPASPGKELRDLLQDCMSPQAVASIASHLQGARTNDPQVDRQVRWFHDQLCELLGGYKQQALLAEEMGL